jgi:hypothetical protein
MIPGLDDLDWMPCAECGRNPAMPGEAICDVCMQKPPGDQSQAADQGPGCAIVASILALVALLVLIIALAAA